MEQDNKLSKIEKLFLWWFGIQGAFVALKLSKLVAWSWWWITLPTWGVFAVVVILAVLLILLLTIASGSFYLTEKDEMY